MTFVVVHYGELALKGRNRPWFIHTLVRSLRVTLRDLAPVEVRSLIGRIIVTLGPDVDWPTVRDRLAAVPGISNFARAYEIPLDLDAMSEVIVGRLAGRTASSFRVTARRADKRFPIPSPDMERAIGRRVQEATGWPVDLSKPAFVIRVEVLSRHAFFFFDREPGAGGLPVGTSGKVLALLSGGIDSPVAAWRVIRRGCRTEFVHFHSYPILSRTSQDKARTLVETLTRSQTRSRLHLVPFGAIQQQVVLSVPPPLRVVIYRRLMVRIAERIAAGAGAHALVTGDAIGQVASQTIDNLAVVGSAATLEILRPLVGMDKEEITAEARRIGTYDTSILQDEDCCTLFTPRYPTTGASRAAVEAAEQALDLPALIDAALGAAVVEEFRFPRVQLATFPIRRKDARGTGAVEAATTSAARDARDAQEEEDA
jgi:thiamine biosynthesis protein ThiI